MMGLRCVESRDEDLGLALAALTCGEMGLARTHGATHDRDQGVFEIGLQGLRDPRAM